MTAPQTRVTPEFVKGTAFTFPAEHEVKFTHRECEHLHVIFKRLAESTDFAEISLFHTGIVTPIQTLRFSSVDELRTWVKANIDLECEMLNLLAAAHLLHSAQNDQSAQFNPLRLAGLSTVQFDALQLTENVLNMLIAAALLYPHRPANDTARHSAPDVIIHTWAPESEQLSSFQNSTLQSLGQRHAISIQTLLTLPPALAEASQQVKAEYVQKLLESAATATGCALAFEAQIGLDSDHEEDMSWADYQEYDQRALGFLQAIAPASRESLIEGIIGAGGRSEHSGVDLGLVIDHLKALDNDRYGLLKVFHPDDPAEATSRSVQLVERWVETHAVPA